MNINKHGKDIFIFTLLSIMDVLLLQEELKVKPCTLLQSAGHSLKNRNHEEDFLKKLYYWPNRTYY